jgi:hypothetical protein
MMHGQSNIKICIAKTSKTDIPVQEDQNKIVQKHCGHLVQQNLQN